MATALPLGLHHVLVKDTSATLWDIRKPSPNWFKLHGVGVISRRIEPPRKPGRNLRLELISHSNAAGAIGTTAERPLW